MTAGLCLTRAAVMDWKAGATQDRRNERHYWGRLKELKSPMKERMRFDGILL